MPINLSPQGREAMRRSKLGAKNPRWNGGTSEYLDHWLLKKMRIEALRRTRGKCKICGAKATVIHHIDESKNNHDLSNLIPLCNPCHFALHKKEYGSSRAITSKFIRNYGMSAIEIANHFGISEDQVRKCLKYGFAPPLTGKDSALDRLREKIRAFVEERHQCPSSF